MIPIVFINCKKIHFIRKILNHQKLFETRTRNMLGRFLGERIALAKTGVGLHPMIMGYATIDEIISVSTFSQWEVYRKYTCIPYGSDYDWKDTTKVKWLYHLTDIEECEPFIPKLGRRHGRVWAEYDPEISC